MTPELLAEVEDWVWNTEADEIAQRICLAEAEVDRLRAQVAAGPPTCADLIMRLAGILERPKSKGLDAYTLNQVVMEMRSLASDLTSGDEVQR